jgi:GNAT superfamily N-acetyltransferase
VEQKRYIGVPVKQYLFHIAVLPEYQGGTAGYLLIKANVDYAKELNKETPTIMYDPEIINPKLAHMLEKLFGFIYTFKDNPKSSRTGGSYTSCMIKFLE